MNPEDGKRTRKGKEGDQTSLESRANAAPSKEKNVKAQRGDEKNRAPAEIHDGMGEKIHP